MLTVGKTKNKPSVLPLLLLEEMTLLLVKEMSLLLLLLKETMRRVDRKRLVPMTTPHSPSPPHTRDPGSAVMSYLCRTIRVLLSAPVQPPPAHPAKSPYDDPRTASTATTTTRRVVSGLEVHLHEVCEG